MEPTSPSLLERLRKPHAEQAWKRFVNLYTPLLYFWACRMGLQADDAADLVQEVFSTLLQKLPDFQYDPKHSFRAWLRTLTTNKWRDMLRRRAAALRHGTDRELEAVAVPDNAEVIWEAEYRRHLAGQALTIMKAEFQDSTWKACWATVVEEKPAAEVASQLGISVESVYAARSRVLRRLRQELEGLLD